MQMLLNRMPQRAPVGKVILCERPSWRITTIAMCEGRAGSILDQ